jgi:hypothetical protein
VSRDHWCRGCGHLVRVSNTLRCLDCGSDQTGIARKLGDLILSRDENSGRGKTHEAQHDAIRQSKYPYTYRLARGFAILNGGSI